MMKTLLSMLVLLSGVIILNGCDKKDEESNKGAYQLRDIGPSGGYIFYINPNYLTDGWKYMEAAPSDQGGMAWGTTETSIQGATGTAIGTGKQNTIDIVNGDPSNTTAADVCTNFSIVKGGVTYDDWFLPSRDELEAMFTNLRLEGVGNFPTDELNEYSAYWSSSQTDPYTAWGKCFQTLVTLGGPKDYILTVRPVRYFQEPGVK